MSYAVVIVNWNGASDTLDCLASIEAGLNEALVVIVDNGSTDDSVARIAKAFVQRGIELHRGTAADVPQGSTPVGAWLIAAGENLVEWRFGELTGAATMHPEGNHEDRAHVGVLEHLLVVYCARN